MKYFKIYIVIISIISLSSCTPKFYIPHGSVTPELNKKGDVYLEGKVNHSETTTFYYKNEASTSFVGAIGYAPTNNFGTYIKGAKGNSKFSKTHNHWFTSGKTITKSEDQFEDIELGIGAFGKFGANGVIDIYLVSQLGSTEHELEESRQGQYLFSNEPYSERSSQNIQTNYFYNGLQSRFGCEFPKFALTLNNRIGSIQYFNIEDSNPEDSIFKVNNRDHSSILFGQDVKIAYGSNLKIFLQAGYLGPLSSDSLVDDESFMAVGASYRFNALK